MRTVWHHGRIVADGTGARSTGSRTSACDANRSYSDGRTRNSEADRPESAHCAEAGPEIRPGSAAYSRDEHHRRDHRPRPHPRRAGPLRERGRLHPEARRLARRRRARDRCRRTDVHRLRRRHRLPEHGPPLRAGRRRDQGPGSTSTSTSASWSASTSPTSRSAGAWPSCRRAGGGTEVDSRQLGRRGGRERGQDRARRPRAGRRSSSSTTRSTAGRC